MITLTDAANEQSTYMVDCVFTDEDGDPVTPNEITWTLTRTSGVVVNSRNAVPVATPASEITIILFGDDLKIFDGDSSPAKRKLLVEALYNSDLGNDLPLRDEATIEITRLVGVE
jgi:hypothetical protein